jgi:hypothetical protein
MPFLERKSQTISRVCKAVYPQIEGLTGMSLVIPAGVVELNAFDHGFNRSMQSFITSAERAPLITTPLSIPMSKGFELGLTPIEILTLHFALGGVLIIDALRKIK